MKTNIFFIICIVFFFAGCDSKNLMKQDSTDDLANMEYLKIDAKRIIIPNLKIKVSLSNDAIQKLQENKEAIIATIVLYGKVKDEDIMPVEIKKNIDANRLKLGFFKKDEKTISQSIVFEFNNLIISKKLYSILTDKNIYINVDVFSGRRVFKDNILNMEAFDTKLRKVVSEGSIIKLNGHLIPEPIEEKQHSP
ncbi:hypothetical protein [Elizabethkingia anophelis]|uniref:hypothetical protein n=1 Tax=Elizabethkingia anophelis TaxID=1117645 RepID=UPI003891760B